MTGLSNPTPKGGDGAFGAGCLLGLLFAAALAGAFVAGAVFGGCGK